MTYFTPGVLHQALKNPTFRKFTNLQSRNAMVFIPLLFAFGFASQKTLTDRMYQVADGTEHLVRSVEWLERHKGLTKEEYLKAHPTNDEQRRMKLYRQALLEGEHPRVRVVPDDSLAMYQKVANYIQSNPLGTIAGIGIPAIAVIFYNQKETLQMRILHTRVYGQFSVICTLLTIMGMKEYMDHHGTYMTETDLETRVQAMADTRQAMLERLE